MRPWATCASTAPLLQRAGDRGQSGLRGRAQQHTGRNPRCKAVLSIFPHSRRLCSAHLKLHLLLAPSKRNVGSFELLRPADPRARKAAEQPEDAHQQAVSANTLHALVRTR